MTTIRPMTREDVPLVAALEAEVEVTPWSERALEDALGPDYYENEVRLVRIKFLCEMAL